MESGAAVLRTEVELARHLRSEADRNDLMEEVCERADLMLTYKRVMKNEGAAGVDANQSSLLGLMGQETVAQPTSVGKISRSPAKTHMSHARGLLGIYPRACRRARRTRQSSRLPVLP